MNIALLVYDISLTGGAEHVALNLAREFKKKNNVTIISVFNQNKMVLDDLVIETLSEKPLSISRAFVKLVKRTHNLLQYYAIDVLISITAGVVTIALAGALGTRTKVIYSEHSNLENKTYGKKHVLRQKIGAKFAVKTVTLTERDRRNFNTEFGTPLDKVVAIPNWYEEKRESNRTYDDKAKRILSVGRLEYVKGYDYMLKVAKKVYFKHPDWQWDIYGEGSLHEELQKEIEKEDLVGFITLKGNVNNIDELYEQYAFLVMTSRYEGLPMSILEAKSHCLPILSFDCPTGPAEMISNGINGYVTKPGDIDSMSQYINILIEDENKRIQFASKSRDDLSKYSKRTVLNQWEELFDMIMEERK